MPNEPCTPHCPAGDCAGCAFPPRAACMGGWCNVRDLCRHYRPGQAACRVEPENLCEPGTLRAFSPLHDITFRPQSNVSPRANSVFDLARVQALGAA